MIRHCLIGNSHAAALKLGWDAVASEHPDHSLTFFGARGKRVGELFVDGDVIRSRAPKIRETMRMLSGGLDEIELGAYDRFWIVGSMFSLSRLFKLHSQFRPESQAAGSGSHQILSDEAYALSARGLYVESATASLIRKLTDRGLRVGIIPQPHPRHAILQTRPNWAELIASDGDVELLSSTFSAALSDAAQNLQATAHMQPAETLHTAVTTRDEYSRGSVGLGDRTHEEQDVVHMNGRYGQVVLRASVLADEPLTSP